MACKKNAVSVSDYRSSGLFLLIFPVYVLQQYYNFATKDLKEVKSAEGLYTARTFIISSVV